MVQLGKRTTISGGGLCTWRSASAVSSDARQEVDPPTASSLEPQRPAARNFLLGLPLKLELSCVRRAIAVTAPIVPPWILSKTFVIQTGLMIVNVKAGKNALLQKGSVKSNLQSRKHRNWLVGYPLTPLHFILFKSKVARSSWSASIVTDHRPTSHSF